MLSRVLIFLFGLVVLSLGIAIVTHAGLGTGTVSSAAIVLSRQTGLSMGLFVFLTNVFFFVLQCLVDPKNLMVKAVKQLPVCAFFGAVFDVAMWVTSFLEPTNYGWAFMQVFLGTCLTGLGVSAMVFARLLVLPPEGFVIAVMHRFGGSFGTIRTSVDVFLVAISVSMSLFFFGTIYGVREGRSFPLFLPDAWPTVFSEGGASFSRTIVRSIDAKKFREARAKTQIFC